jgi:hypothetical protein
LRHAHGCKQHAGQKQTAARPRFCKQHGLLGSCVTQNSEAGEQSTLWAEARGRRQ